jgi:hypothetical protein
MMLSGECSWSAELAAAAAAAVVLLTAAAWKGLSRLLPAVLGVLATPPAG